MTKALNKHNGNKTHQIRIRVGRLITPCKESRSQSRWERNLVLNKDHEITEYIEAVRDRRQTQVLTKYRPSDPKVTPEQRRSGSRAHWSGYTSLKRCQIMHAYRRTCELVSCCMLLFLTLWSEVELKQEGQSWVKESQTWGQFALFYVGFNLVT